MKKLILCAVIVCCIAGATVADTIPGGALQVPPVETGPMTIDGGTSGDYHQTVIGAWPNYITGMSTGQWRLEVTGIDLSGVTGVDNRGIRFQLANVSPYPSDTAYPWQWHSLSLNLRLDNDFGSGLVNADLLQIEESNFRAEFWDVITSGGYRDADVNRADLDLRMDFGKANAGDPWSVTPSFRLPGGDWTVFDQGGATTTYSWDFGAPEGQIWPDDGGTMLDAVFHHGATGTLSFDNASITVVPEPSSLAALATGLLAVGGVFCRRRRMV